MPGPFADATAVQRADGGSFTGAIAPGFDIGGNANGGYLLAIAGRALAAATGRPDPVTVTAHYLSPGAPGAVTVETSVVKSGKRFATVSGVMRAGDRPVLSVLGSFSDLSQADGPERVDADPPVLPDPDECYPILPGPDSAYPPPFMGKVEMRLHPDDASFMTSGVKCGEPIVRGWFRLPGGEPVDTIALLCAVDAFPPTVFNTDLPVSWVPTLELTAHLRARPEPGWLRCVFRTRFVTGGFLEEDGEIWDATGRLVAQSRQLALVPRAPLV